MRRSATAPIREIRQRVHSHMPRKLLRMERRGCSLAPLIFANLVSLWCPFLSRSIETCEEQ